jgi:hypothetical protein
MENYLFMILQKTSSGRRRRVQYKRSVNAESNHTPVVEDTLPNPVVIEDNRAESDEYSKATESTQSVEQTAASSSSTYDQVQELQVRYY